MEVLGVKRRTKKITLFIGSITHISYCGWSGGRLRNVLSKQQNQLLINNYKISIF